jgi:hypothetical protein
VKGVVEEPIDLNKGWPTSLVTPREFSTLEVYLFQAAKG